MFRSHFMQVQIKCPVFSRELHWTLMPLAVLLNCSLIHHTEGFGAEGLFQAWTFQWRQSIVRNKVSKTNISVIVVMLASWHFTLSVIHKWNRIFVWIVEDNNNASNRHKTDRQSCTQGCKKKKKFPLFGCTSGLAVVIYISLLSWFYPGWKFSGLRFRVSVKS